MVDALYLEERSWRVLAIKVTPADHVARELESIRIQMSGDALEIPMLLVRSVGETVTLAVPFDALRTVLATVAANDTDGTLPPIPES